MGNTFFLQDFPDNIPGKLLHKNIFSTREINSMLLDEFFPDNDFLKMTQMLDEAEKCYKNKEYSESINLIDSIVNDQTASNGLLLSLLFDLKARSLWKLKEFENAKTFWNKSLELCSRNRHACLCLDWLKRDDFLDKNLKVFLQIKMEEFYYKKEVENQKSKLPRRN